MSVRVAPLTSRLRIILWIFIVVILATLGFTVYKVIEYMRKDAQVPVEKTVQTSIPTFSLPPQAQEQQKPPPPPQAQPILTAQQVDLVTIVVPFVERFGSFSNQSNYQNFEDLLPFMSSSMRAWAEAKIADARSKPFPSLYKGVTTKVLKHTSLSLDEQRGVAGFKVTTQRKELLGTSDNFKVYLQDIVVRLVKQDSLWVVDSARWQ